MRWTSLLATLMILSPPGMAAADDLDLDAYPPVVVKAHPQAGAADVDTELAEIRVTFSKPMASRSWFWATHGLETFPTVDGTPRYLEDKRTCVLPVQLEPGRTYALWINSAQYKNFKDTGGRPAIPYLLVFRTKELAD